VVTPPISLDPFAPGLGKLLTVLDLAAPCSVMTLGDLPAVLQGAGGGQDSRIDVRSEADLAHGRAGRYDLILWRPRYSGFRTRAAQLAAHLSPRGVLVAFCENRLSLFRGRRSLRALSDSSLQSLAGYRQSLQKAGMRVIGCWLPWPSIDDAEEFLSIDDADEVAQSTGLASHMGVQLRVAGHDGYVILARLTASDSSPLPGATVAEAAREALAAPTPLRLTRFDIRQRGALVVMLAAGDGPAVGRITASPEVAAHLDANERSILHLREDAAARPELLAMLPLPLGRANVGAGGTMWLERRLPGVVAWRLPVRLHATLDAGWMEFLLRLAGLRRPQQVFGRGVVSELISRWRISPQTLPLGVRSEVTALEAWIIDQLCPTQLKLGWAHGDFGYGNLLAERSTGKLQAVIDWETASRDEPLGIDWMNLLLSRARMDAGATLSSAVAAVALRCRSPAVGDRPAEGLRSFLAGLQGCSVMVLLGLALLRVVQREARYPTLFMRSAEEYRRALRLFGELARG
jgi:hypothetical protein